MTNEIAYNHTTYGWVGYVMIKLKPLTINVATSFTFTNYDLAIAFFSQLALLDTHPCPLVGRDVHLMNGQWLAYFIVCSTNLRC